MTFKYRYRKQIIIGIIISVLLISSSGSLIYYLSTKKKPLQKSILVTTKKAPKIKEQEQSIYYKVDIKGEVVTPGIYTLKNTSRIIDVIEQAGGLTGNANTTVINLSKKITDEMVIIIYSNDEVSNFKKTKEIENSTIERCIQKDNESLKNDACIEKSPQEQAPDTKVSINTGTVEELMTLTGIGEAKAKDIIAYRDEHGAFKSIEEIKNVSGIGDSVFAKIKENITI